MYANLITLRGGQLLLTREFNSQKLGGKFANVPLDMSHIHSRTRKTKKGDHLRGTTTYLEKRPSLHDFPRDWLPSEPIEQAAVPPTSA